MNLLIASAQTMKVHMKNGSVSSFKINEIDFIDFTENEEADDNPVYFGDRYIATYEQSFIATFGQVDPNHNWGFNFATTRSDNGGYKYRVIAEDLVSNDFDFNDVVFDVEEVTEGVRITVLAVGTTVPMIIFDREVHELFGVSTNQMINTDDTNQLTPVSFVVNASPSYLRVFSLVNGVNPLLLEVKTGRPTPMIAVAPDFEWCTERQAIHHKYELFPQWVQNPGVKWYESKYSQVYFDVNI